MSISAFLEGGSHTQPEGPILQIEVRASVKNLRQE